MNGSTRPTRCWILALCCVLALGGCKSWEPSGPAPAAGRPLGTVRVTLANGSVMMLEQARVRGDSIVGSLPKTTTQTAVALADVRKTEIRRIDPASTFWVGFLSVGAVLGAWVYVVTHSAT